MSKLTKPILVALLLAPLAALCAQTAPPQSPPGPNLVLAPRAVPPHAYEEPYRPQFHFSSEQDFLADPNGLVYFEGEYHLMYQLYPMVAKDGYVPRIAYWGHAVSKDLVHWENLPIALFPDTANGWKPYSGSAIVDWKDRSGLFGGKPGLVAIFTHQSMKEQNRTVQSLAYSTDRGRTWTMYKDNPVIAWAPDSVRSRDPKVFWHEPTQRFVAVTGGTMPVILYSSPDLLKWTRESTFDGFGGECPDLFPLAADGDPKNVKWIYSGAGCNFYLGPFDGKRMLFESPARRSFRPGAAYAAQTWSDMPPGDTRRVMIRWMNGGDPQDYTKTKTSPWIGCMTLPVELTLRRSANDWTIYQTPVKELESLRMNTVALTNQEVAPDVNLLAKLAGDVFEVEATFELGTAKAFGFKVRTGGQEETLVGYDVTKARAFVDCRKSGWTCDDPKLAELIPGLRFSETLAPENNRITLRFFVDKTSVELFCNNGIQYLSAYIYPDPASRGISTYAVGGNVKLVDFKFHELASIWKTTQSTQGPKKTAP